MPFIANIINTALFLYSLVIIAEVMISWLIVFEVINVRNDKAQNLIRLLKKLTDPLYSRIRKFVPPIGGMDLTPLIVLLGIWFLQMLVVRIFYGFGWYYY